MSRGYLKIGLNSIYQFSAKLINALTGLLIISLILRNSNEQLVGAYTTAITYISLYFTFIDAGLNSIIVKHLIQNPRDKSQIISNTFTLRLLIAAFTLLLAIGIAQFLTGPGYTEQVRGAILIGSVALFAQAVLATLNALIQSEQNYRTLIPINIANGFVQVCGILLISSNYTITNLILTYLAGALITFAIAVYVLHTKTRSLHLQIQWGMTKKILRESFPITLSMLTNLIYFRVDALILPAYRDLAEIGKYNIAYRIFDNILVLPSYATNSAYPALLQKQLHSKQQFSHSFHKLLGVYIIISIVITLLAYQLAPFLVLLINGEQNEGILNYFRILCLGTPFFFTSSALMANLIIQARQKWLAYIYTASMIISITLNSIVIPIYGATGAAYLTISLEALVCIIGLYAIYLHPHLPGLYRRRLTR